MQVNSTQCDMAKEQKLHELALLLKVLFLAVFSIECVLYREAKAARTGLCSSHLYSEFI